MRGEVAAAAVDVGMEEVTCVCGRSVEGEEVVVTCDAVEVVTSEDEEEVVVGSEGGDVVTLDCVVLDTESRDGDPLAMAGWEFAREPAVGGT